MLMTQKTQIFSLESAWISVHLRPNDVFGLFPIKSIIYLLQVFVLLSYLILEQSPSNTVESSSEPKIHQIIRASVHGGNS